MNLLPLSGPLSSTCPPDRASAPTTGDMPSRVLFSGEKDTLTLSQPKNRQKKSRKTPKRPSTSHQSAPKPKFLFNLLDPQSHFSRHFQQDLLLAAKPYLLKSACSSSAVSQAAPGDDEELARLALKIRRDTGIYRDTIESRLFPDTKGHTRASILPAPENSRILLPATLPGSHSAVKTQDTLPQDGQDLARWTKSLFKQGAPDNTDKVTEPVIKVAPRAKQYKSPHPKHAKAAQAEQIEQPCLVEDSPE